MDVSGDATILGAGQPVEVRSSGGWLPAKILAVQAAGIRIVEYEAGGKESIFCGRSNPPGEAYSSDSCSRGSRVRPRPPYCSSVSSKDWKRGLLVEAYGDSWQEGVLLEAPSLLSTHVQVFFGEDGGKKHVSMDNLRVSQSWNEAANAWVVRGYDQGSDLLPEPETRPLKPQRTFQRKRKRKGLEDDAGKSEEKKQKQEENGSGITTEVAVKSQDLVPDILAADSFRYVDVEPMQGVEESEEKGGERESEAADEVCLTKTFAIPVCCINTQSEDPLFGDELRLGETDRSLVDVSMDAGERLFDSSSQGSFHSCQDVSTSSDLKKTVALSVSRSRRKKRKVPTDVHRRDTIKEARENVLRNLEASGWKKGFRERQRENRTSQEAYYIAPDGTSYHSLTSACTAWMEQNKGESKTAREEMRSYQIIVRRNSSLAESHDTNGVEGAAVKRKLRPTRLKKLKSVDNPQKGRPLLNALLLTPTRSKQDGTDEPVVPRRATMFSWLIEASVLSENATVFYLNDDKQAIAKGVATRDGVLCNCCNKSFSMRNFQLHADTKVHKTASHIVLEDGRSILDCQNQALKKIEDAKAEEQASVQTAVDESDECCGLCGEGGELICCDNCPATFHLHCILLKSLPEGDWFCPKCRCPVCGAGQFDGREVVFCTQCERSYHAGCLNDEGLCLSKSRFCSQTCLKIFCGLRGLVGITSPLDGGFTWTLVRSEEEDHEADLETVTENSSKLALALTVMRECFSPMIDPRRKIDIVAHIVKNRSADLKRLDFRGFFCFFLEKNDELISVAAVRVHGTSIAEMPLIGTRLQYRRQGMCRRLMEVIEQVLRSLSVDTLVLPAVPELLDTWIGAFGFQKVTPFQSVRLLEFSLVGFPGTKVLQKPLTWLNLCRKLAPPLVEKPWTPGSALHMGIDPEPHRKPKSQKHPVAVKTEDVVVVVPPAVQSNQALAVLESSTKEEVPALKEEPTEDSRIVVAKTRSNRLVKASKRFVEALETLKTKKPEGDPASEPVDVENTSELSFLKLGFKAEEAAAAAAAKVSEGCEMEMIDLQSGFTSDEGGLVFPDDTIAESGESCRRDDELFLAKMKGKKCGECGTSETPMWRKGPASNLLLCNACGIRWKKMLATEKHEKKAL